MQAGLGDPLAYMQVYIANRPDYADIPNRHEMLPLRQGDVAAIGQACGNGWRKVFNVYAKLLFALASHLEQNNSDLVQQFPQWLSLPSLGYDSWQAFRDNQLLQSSSDTALVFEPPSHLPHYATPEISNSPVRLPVRLVMGRAYAKSLNISGLVWLNNEFAIAPSQRVIVCPYFDYRQLSNLKIIYLVDLISDFVAGKFAEPMQAQQV